MLGRAMASTFDDNTNLLGGEICQSAQTSDTCGKISHEKHKFVRGFRIPSALMILHKARLVLLPHNRISVEKGSELPSNRAQ